MRRPAARRRGPAWSSASVSLSTSSSKPWNSAALADDELRLAISRWRLSLQGMEESGAPLDEVLVEPRLDRLLDLLRDVEQKSRVIRSVRPVSGEIDRFAELDAPLGRQRDQAQRSEPGERRRDRHEGGAHRARHRPRVPELWVDLLRSHHG